MTTTNDTLTIHILGKSYQIKCPEEESQALQAAAAYLEEKMQYIKMEAKMINHENIMIITALNIVDDFLKLKNSYDRDSIKTRLCELRDKVSFSLDKNIQMELSSAE